MKIHTENKKESIFKSKPFFKKIEAIDDSFISKYLFYIFMMLILSIAFSLLFGFGFSIESNINLTLKAISIFCLSWFVLFFIWWIIQTHYYLKLADDKNKWIEIFSFLVLFNLISIIRLSKKISRTKFNEWLTIPFQKTNFENGVNLYFNKKWYLNLICLIIMSPLLVLIWFPDGMNIVEFYKLNSGYDNMWFEGFHYFTIQTNLLCFLYLLVFVINPRIKLFDNDSVLICLLAYIFIVSFTYNFFLLPSNSSKTEWIALKWVKTCWEHIINPVAFIGIEIYLMCYTSKKSSKHQDYLTTLKFGMVIPSIYLCYALLLPFVANKSVYGFITNCNPNLMNSEGSLLKHGEWYMLFCILAYWFVFVGIITMFWRIKYSFYQKYWNKNI
ncbi:MAG: DUF1600 domain-containing protein [Ureaplasma sp.]|nr:DUF1600 domain-containing protein [Ureaplasma sp.]